MASLLSTLPISVSQLSSPRPKSKSRASGPFQARSSSKNHEETENSNNAAGESKLDRRNLLMGIGGLYGATNLATPARNQALAAPISAPDLAKCSRGVDLNTNQPLDVDCCPPISKIIDYKLPPVRAVRFRPAAHLATRSYVAKYERALALMKALPEEDPRSFMQQANVHCAYCNLTYETPDSDPPNAKLQIHSSWLFFPWHRWYLYFYERILGKLIDDPTFGLPFWNWDHPDGMVMPAMFAREGSPLYNALRNTKHYPPAVADLNYAGSDSTSGPDQVVVNNLVEMYGEMIRNVSGLEDFYGARYTTNTPIDPGPGTLERGSHNALHRWVGQATTEGFDMGNFYTTGREPLFYSHHVNVDRLWSVFRYLRGPNRPKDFSDPDWLDANFLFYDEEARLVRVKVSDTLENYKMGYEFQKVDLPWLKSRPTARTKKSRVASKVGKAPDTIFPVTLDRIVKVLVDRPKKSRSQKDKEQEKELLVIEGIEVDTSKFVRFDVYVNDEDDKPDELVDKAEYAGCYSQLPHKKSTRVKSKIRLGLTELLEDLDVEDDDQILVSLVPKAGGEDITIGSVKIVYETLE